MAFKYAIGFRFWCSSIPGERFKNRKGVGFIMFYPNARFWLSYCTDKTTAPHRILHICAAQRGT